MIEAYSNMPNSYWQESHIKSLIAKFPEGLTELIPEIAKGITSVKPKP